MDKSHLTVQQNLGQWFSNTWKQMLLAPLLLALVLFEAVYAGSLPMTHVLMDKYYWDEKAFGPPSQRFLLDLDEQLKPFVDEHFLATEKAPRVYLCDLLLSVDQIMFKTNIPREMNLSSDPMVEASWRQYIREGALSAGVKEGDMYDRWWYIDACEFPDLKISHRVAGQPIRIAVPLLVVSLPDVVWLKGDMINSDALTAYQLPGTKTDNQIGKKNPELSQLPPEAQDLTSQIGKMFEPASRRVASKFGSGDLSAEQLGQFLDKIGRIGWPAIQVLSAACSAGEDTENFEVCDTSIEIVLSNTVEDAKLSFEIILEMLKKKP